MRNSPRDAVLADECRLFCRYLTGDNPHADVVAAYGRAHELGRVDPQRSRTALDRALVRMARTGPAFARLADRYASVFARTSVLRQKLVLLVAILESRAETAELIDGSAPGSRAGWVLTMTLRCGAAAVTTVFAAALLVPLRLWYSLASQTDEQVVVAPPAVRPPDDEDRVVRRRSTTEVTTS